MNLFAALSIVCAAWFEPSAGWHQPARVAATFSPSTGAQAESWAATFPVSARYGISRGFPVSGVYISVNLVRPPAYGSVWRSALRFPLRLRDATKNPSFKAPRLTTYRFVGRFRHQYNVDVQVIVARNVGAAVLARAQAELRRLTLPRWIPVPSRC